MILSTSGHRASALSGQSIIAFPVRNLNLQRGEEGKGTESGFLFCCLPSSAVIVSLAVVSPNIKSPFLGLIRVLGLLARGSLMW